MSLSLTYITFERIDRKKLEDSSSLSALLVTVANAVDLSALGRPVLSQSEHGIAGALVGQGGHVVIHTRPGTGFCAVDIAVPRSTPASLRALDILERRLGARRTDIETCTVHR